MPLTTSAGGWYESKLEAQVEMIEFCFRISSTCEFTEGTIAPASLNRTGRFHASDPHGTVDLVHSAMVRGTELRPTVVPLSSSCDLASVDQNTTPGRTHGAVWIRSGVRAPKVIRRKLFAAKHKWVACLAEVRLVRSTASSSRRLHSGRGGGSDCCVIQRHLQG